MTDRTDGIALAAILALATLLMGVAIWVAAVRTQVDSFDVRKYVTAKSTTSTLCCKAGTHGSGGGPLP